MAKEMRIIIEVSNDNIYYRPYFEFGKGALCMVEANGKTEHEFILSTFYSCESLLRDPAVKNYRMIVQSNGVQYYVFGNCPMKKTNEQGNLLEDADILVERKKYITLTAKEIEILEYTYKTTNLSKVQSELKIQLSTFRLHLKRIYKKLDLHSSKQLYKWCERFLSSMK